MDLEEWWPWYERIIRALNYSRHKDQRATDILSELLEGRFKGLDEVRDHIEGRPVLVFGAGPSLEANVRAIRKRGPIGLCRIISADGATTALLGVGNLIPDIVVTDLDGRVRDLLLASKMGSFMAIHAHGDNIPLIERYVPRLKKVIGTTQVEPRPNVYNFGGFTDGDRAVFLAVTMGAGSVALAGMDLGGTIGLYSGRAKSDKKKPLKLSFCKELLEWLASRAKIGLYNLTGGGERIQGFRDITPDEYFRLLKR